MIHIREYALSIFVCLFFLHPFYTFGQPQNEYRHVPFFFTYSPKVLTTLLTSGLKSDSAKVAAIHGWITHNIKYDVRFLTARSYPKQSIKRILFRKKAICGGYADLFVEMCKDAGMEAVSVDGYTKNMHVDIVDSFYVQDHAWNAVLVEGSWQLVDPTWDAGFVRPYSKNLWDVLLGIVTLGAINQYSGPPIFITAPTHHYYLKDPKVFMVDHFPLHPIWQLTSSKKNIATFKDDSAYYYKKIPASNSYPYSFSNANDGARSGYFAMTDLERIKDDGIKGYAVNHDNHYCLAEAMRINAIEAAKNMIQGSKDSIELVKGCDSILKYADSGLTQYDLNDSMLEIQMNRLMEHNAQKKLVFMAYNMDLITGTAHMMRKIKGVRHTSRSVYRYLLRVERSNQRRDHKFHASKSFYRPKSSLYTHQTDSLEIRLELAKIDDSLHHETDSLNRWFLRMDSTYFRYKALVDSFVPRQTNDFFLALGSGFTRSAGFDDFDYEIKSTVSVVLVQKPKTDSLLFTHGIFLTHQLHEDLRAVGGKLSGIHTLYRQKSRLLSKLMHTCEHNDLLYKMFTTNEDSLHQALNSTYQWLHLWKTKWHALSHVLEKEKQPVKTEWKLWKSNSRIERYNSASRSHFAHHNATRLRNTGRYNKACLQYLENMARKYRERIMPWKMKQQVKPDKTNIAISR